MNKKEVTGKHVFVFIFFLAAVLTLHASWSRRLDVLFEVEVQVLAFKECYQLLPFHGVGLHINLEECVPEFYLLGLRRVFVLLGLGELNKHLIVFCT